MNCHICGCSPCESPSGCRSIARMEEFDRDAADAAQDADEAYEDSGAAEADTEFEEYE